MEIVYHSSDTFAPILGVSILSLFENNRRANYIRVWIIEHDISEINKQLLKQIAKTYDRDMQFIPMPNCNEEFQIGLRAVRKKWLFDSYCRLFLNRILPSDIKRVIYLDSDVLIMDSLEELWNIDMNGFCIAGVLDGLSRNYYKLWNLAEQAQYCNSGVLLIDLNLWRKNTIDKEVQNFVHNQHGYVFFMEQTVFNVVLASKIFILPARYNVQTAMSMLSYKQMLTLRKPVHYYDKQEFEEARRHPAILHMTSNAFLVKSRAWVRGSNHPAASIYQKYAKMTPWGEAAILPDTRGRSKRVLDTAIARVPRCVLIPVVGWIYNYARVWTVRRTMRKIANE